MQAYDTFADADETSGLNVILKGRGADWRRWRNDLQTVLTLEAATTWRTRGCVLAPAMSPRRLDPMSRCPGLHLRHLPRVSTFFGQVLERKATETALQSELVEIQSRGHTTEDDVLYRPEVGVARGSWLMASESPKIRDILTQVELVAPTSATVLLLGETGAGKEVFAQAIHDLSPRHQRQMIRVSCAAIPSALVESELFGCERGAFTDAVTRRIGRFEAASQSTLFLDEIGDLPANAQVKLLRVLQDHVIERLGSTHPIKIDVRIIVATNRNLERRRRRQVVSGRPVLSSQCVSDRRAATSRASRRHCGTGVAVRRRIRAIVRQADRVDFERVDARTAVLLMAGQRP